MTLTVNSQKNLLTTNFETLDIFVILSYTLSSPNSVHNPKHCDPEEVVYIVLTFLERMLEYCFLD